MEYLTEEEVEAIGQAILDHGFHPWEGLQPWTQVFARKIQDAANEKAKLDQNDL